MFEVQIIQINILIKDHDETKIQTDHNFELNKASILAHLSGQLTVGHQEPLVIMGLDLGK